MENMATREALQDSVGVARFLGLAWSLNVVRSHGFVADRTFMRAGSRRGWETKDRPGRGGRHDAVWHCLERLPGSAEWLEDKILAEASLRNTFAGRLVQCFEQFDFHPRGRCVVRDLGVALSSQEMAKGFRYRRTKSQAARVLLTKLTVRLLVGPSGTPSTASTCWVALRTCPPHTPSTQQCESQRVVAHLVDIVVRRRVSSGGHGLRSFTPFRPYMDTWSSSMKSKSLNHVQGSSVHALRA